MVKSYLTGTIEVKANFRLTDVVRLHLTGTIL
jgi:hypothetical protein